jgi:dephospho-CoA kinase
MMMSKPIRILINGGPCVGKDETADFLVACYGFKKIAFADGIYEISRKLFGMTTKDRALLQAIGEKLREVDPDVWVKDAYRRALDFPRVVISDCRRQNEYWYGVRAGFTPIRIQADMESRIARSRSRDGVEPDISLWSHNAETDADNLDYINIDNNGTIEDLHRKVNAVLNQVVTLNLDGNTTTGSLWNNQVGE